MTRKPEDIIIEYLKNKFGSMISKLIFEQNLAKAKIKHFDKISTQEKINFGKKTIESVFNEFYPEDHVKNMQTLYLLRFALNEAAAKVEQMLSTTSDLGMTQAGKIDPSKLNEKLDIINSEKFVKINFTCSNLINGTLVLLIEKNNAIEFAKTIMKLTMGIEDDKQEFDELSKSAIFEFFNIVIPAFTKVIGDIYDEELLFIPSSVEEFKSRYFVKEIFQVPKKIIKTKIKMNVAEMEHEYQSFFFYENAKMDLAEEQSRQETPKLLELHPPVLLLKKTNDPKKDIRKLCKLIDVPEDAFEIELATLKLKIEELNNEEVFEKFFDGLTLRFFKGQSLNLKNSVRTNLKYVLEE